MTTFEDLVRLIHRADEKKVLEDLILGLTTPHERRILERRVEIIKRLLDGEDQHQIAEELNVGVSTVTRGAKELNLGRFKILRRKKKR